MDLQQLLKIHREQNWSVEDDSNGRFFMRHFNQDHIKQIMNTFTPLEKQEYANRMIGEVKPQTILEFAIEHQLQQVIKFLIEECGGGLNVPDPNNNTPLHVAARKNDVDTVKLLLEHGANPNYPNNYGSTALHLAAEWNATETVEELVSHSYTDISPQNLGGMSALDVAHMWHAGSQGVKEYDYTNTVAVLKKAYEAAYAANSAAIVAEEEFSTDTVASASSSEYSDLRTELQYNIVAMEVDIREKEAFRQEELMKSNLEKLGSPHDELMDCDLFDPNPFFFEEESYFNTSQQEFPGFEPHLGGESL